MGFGEMGLNQPASDCTPVELRQKTISINQKVVCMHGVFTFELNIDETCR